MLILFVVQIRVSYNNFQGFLMSKVIPIDEEFVYEGRVIISQTDTKGMITFVNRKFCEVSKYSADELVGHGHNFIRHPDMPKAIFEKMWEVISDGQIWTGVIKNLRKDGLYYWTEAEILPIFNANNVLTGYIAARKPASRKNINESAALYKKMLATE